MSMKWYDDEIIEDILDIADTGLTKNASDMQQLAQSRAPVKTGNLQSNIIVEQRERDADTTAVIVGVDASVEYAEAQEDRTHFLESSAQDLAALLPDYIVNAAEKKQGI